MRAREQKLLKIAEEVIYLNHDLGAMLTGSLMLIVRGFDKLREARDIDILCEYLCEESEGFPRVPKGFKRINMEGRKSQVNTIAFKNEEGIKIDFMLSEEKAEMINGIPCGQLDYMLAAKQTYATNDKDIVSRLKHSRDLDFLKSREYGINRY